MASYFGLSFIGVAALKFGIATSGVGCLENWKMDKGRPQAAHSQEKFCLVIAPAGREHSLNGQGATFDLWFRIRMAI